MPQIENQPSSRPPRTRFQFSLFRLMVLVTLVAVILGLASRFGYMLGVALVALAWCVLPTPLAICAIFGRRDVQAFAIGALIPWFMLVAMLSPPGFLATVWCLFLGIVCGALAVLTRRWLERNDL
jgi:hypothetical protein